MDSCHIKSKNIEVLGSRDEELGACRETHETIAEATSIV